MEPNWSELCPDVLRCVLERLSFTNLNRAKLVCSAWYSASRGCIFKNQIPWLILVPHEYENNNRCVLFVPDDRDKVYRTRDLGLDFVRSCCLATYGGWLLMMDRHYNLNIVNPLTGERIDLPIIEYTKNIHPYSNYFYLETNLNNIRPSCLACLWIDHKSKDYIVVWTTREKELVFTKKANNMWRHISHDYNISQQLVYKHKSQKLYHHRRGCDVNIWCLSGDVPQRVFDNIICRGVFNMVLSTVSGEVLKVYSIMDMSKRWLFCVYKMHPIKQIWQVVHSLGDEALILDMGVTVVAKDIPGIKRNSIYFSGYDYHCKNTDSIFVFDLAIREIEPLPQIFFSSIRFSDARWFFPGLSP